MDDVSILYMVDNYDDMMVVLHITRLECEAYGDTSMIPYNLYVIIHTSKLTCHVIFYKDVIS